MKPLYPTSTEIAEQAKKTKADARVSPLAANEKRPEVRQAFVNAQRSKGFTLEAARKAFAGLAAKKC